MATASSIQIAVAISNDKHQLGRTFLTQVLELLKEVRGINVDVVNSTPPSRVSIPASSTISDVLSALSTALSSASKQLEAETFDHVLSKCLEKISFGGLGLSDQSIEEESDRTDTLFLVDAWLEALNSQDRAKGALPTTTLRAKGTRPMTLTEKIFAHHTLGGCPVEGLKAGDVIRASLDWVIASELSWSGMLPTLREIGSEKVWRNDRFWLAGDHVVDPRINHVPKIQALIKNAEDAKKKFKMTDYQGLNYTIMHTEFARTRAQPGMLILGSDSHTCSSGANGCLAIGLGAADVAMGLTTGETWFKIPESILIEFIGKPAPGMGGKDVILYILQQLKRNTVASDRIVEFSGPGMKYLSCDARFAIANMCTEFGAVTGIFAPDDVTLDFISQRKQKTDRSNSTYFARDADAAYAGRYTIDLAKVESFVARYPSPDDVVPVSEVSGKHLDGVFIGACTTTEEDLVLAALVLQSGLKKGLPQAKGRRHVVPGSLPIVEKLRSHGLLEVFEQAGFTRGPPGCSFCVGMGADKAGEGETWLSSQNRNFKNRMGKGAIGSITAATVVAASSFSMTIADPASFLADLDMDFFQRYRNISETAVKPVTYVEPHVGPLPSPSSQHEGLEKVSSKPREEFEPLGKITSKIVVLGDFIDTDALAPAEFLIGAFTDTELGTHCLEYTHPEFRSKVQHNNQRVVVGGKGFGCGSSREQAVSALVGAGVQAVIAKSFAFIYGRNQPTLGLLGITIPESETEFYQLAKEGEEITVDVPERVVRVGGKEFGFAMSDMEYRLTTNRGMNEAYKRFGPAIWEKMTEKDKEAKIDVMAGNETGDAGDVDERLRW